MNKNLKNFSLEPNERLRNYAVPKIAFVAGAALVTAGDRFYLKNINQFYGYAAPQIYSLVSLLFVVLAAISFAVAMISYLQVESRILPTVMKGSNVMHWRIGRIIADAFFGEKKIVVLAALLYALLFAFLDGILIYQPGVDFSAAYAVNGPTWRVVTCCGSPGNVPVGLLYLPTQHIGLQLIPLSILIMILVSALVRLNLSLLYRAFTGLRSEKLNVDGKRGITSGVFGVVFGLFTGCPTCAAAFFLSTIAGTGSTVFSAAIAKYQPLIVTLTIPMLLASAYWQAKSIRTLLQGCASSPRL